MPRGADRVAAALAGVAALIAYVLTLAPTVTAEDSGELAAAAWTLGVPHPPGYPLWCLLARAFMVVPVGDVAFRGNLFSAVCGAASVALVSLIASRLGARAWIAGGMAVLLGISSTLWSQAVITEVYTLGLLTLLACIHALLVWRDSGDERWLLWAALVYALSLGAHHTALFLAPVVLLYLLASAREPGSRVSTGWTAGRIGRIALALALGLAVYAYLPLRAAAQPAINWGDPDTWERFWAHVTRAQYQPIDAPRAAALGQQLAATARSYLDQWPLPVSLLVLVAAVLGVPRLPRPQAVLLAASFAVLVAGYVAVLNVRMEPESLHVAEVFYIPAWTCLALLAARGLDGPLARRAPAATALVLGTIVAWSAFANGVTETMAGNTVAHRYAADLLSTLPPNAILLTSADYEAFPLAYAQIVEGERRDVDVLDEERDLARALKLVGEDPSYPEPLSLLAAQDRRPVFATRRLAANGVAWDPVGLLLRARPSTRGARTESREYAPLPQGPWLRNDRFTASIAAAYAEARARAALAAGRVDDALREVQAAATFLPGDPVGQNRLGALLATGGALRPALDYYVRAAALRPGYVEPRYNLIAALIQLQAWDAAQTELDRARADGIDLGPAGLQMEAVLAQARGRR